MSVTLANCGDGALVSAARDGDKTAFACLLDRHQAVLLALCRRTLRDPLLAEDAAHEAILHSMLGLDQLRRPERFGPWLCGIGLNICRRWLRDRSSHCWSWEALIGGGYFHGPSNWQPDPAALVEEAELADRVRRAVDILPTGQRAAVLLFYLSGLTYSETAALLGIEVGAVKTRLHKARETLRRELWSVWEDAMATNQDTEMVEMHVADVRRVQGEDDETPRYVVALQDVGGTQRLPIWIGKPEAEGIAIQLEAVETPRPLTFALTAGLLRAAGAEVKEVQINRLDDNVFYASVVLDGPQGRKSVDARPSDAMNLALAVGAPIRAERGVLDEVALSDRADEASAAGGEGAAEIAASVKQQYQEYTRLKSKPNAE